MQYYVFVFRGCDYVALHALRLCVIEYHNNLSAIDFAKIIL